MKINKLLFSTALLPVTLIPTISLTSCSNIEGIKSIASEFSIEYESTSPSKPVGILTINLVYNTNIKSITGYDSYIINGSSVIIYAKLPFESKEGSQTIKGKIEAHAIDDSVYTILYSMNSTVSKTTLSSSTYYYVSSISDLKFWDPTKI